MDKRKHGVMMQAFEWYLPEDMKHWDNLAQKSEELSNAGITALWLPPAYKGQAGIHDVGYGVYDLYDLGEFDQKGSIPTKYGTREQFLNCIKKLQEHGIDVYCDVVFNHMMGADESEIVVATEHSPTDREETISGYEEIQAWTKFNFTARNGKYSDFTWDKSCFDGTDWNQRDKETAIFKFKGQQWDEGVDKENGNYDYLMGADLSFNNNIVRNQLKTWGDWFVRTTKLDGFRLDACKHIDSNFFPEWLNHLRNLYSKELFSVGEYWSKDIYTLKNYLEESENCMSLFDVPLHFKLHEISNSNGSFDLTKIFDSTLVSENPVKSVTFVDNHDTQTGQALESPIENWFIPQAYAIILLRTQGYPCIFYGHYYGMQNHELPSFKETIDKLLFVRHNKIGGLEHQYLDDKNVVGWTFEGEENTQNTGCAVILTDTAKNQKKMYVGLRHAGEVWTDILGNAKEEVTIDKEGNGLFKVNDGSVSVYCKKEN